LRRPSQGLHFSLLADLHPQDLALGDLFDYGVLDHLALLGEGPDVSGCELDLHYVFRQLLDLSPLVVRLPVDLIFVRVDLLRSPHPQTSLIIDASLVVLAEGE